MINIGCIQTVLFFLLALSWGFLLGDSYSLPAWAGLGFGAVAWTGGLGLYLIALEAYDKFRNRRPKP
jgi:hypothetical protein